MAYDIAAQDDRDDLSYEEVNDLEYLEAVLVSIVNIAHASRLLI